MDKLKDLKADLKQLQKSKTAEDRKKILKKLWQKYKMVFWYLVFGALTTLMNIIVYAVSMSIMKTQNIDEDVSNIVSNIIAWIVAVIFAYITNRKWVFESERHTKKEITKEVCSFFVARIATGVIDLLIMFITVNLFHWPDILMKIISNIIVIILNFIFSKFVFGKSKISRKKSKNT